jgi:hypothetical protein
MCQTNVLATSEINRAKTWCVLAQLSTYTASLPSSPVTIADGCENLESCKRDEYLSFNVAG